MENKLTSRNLKLAMKMKTSYYFLNRSETDLNSNVSVENVNIHTVDNENKNE